MNSIYNLFFHPLSGYPGPWLNALSPLVDLIVQYRGGGHRHIRGLHEQYGPVVRIAPDSLSFDTSQAARGKYFVLCVKSCPRAHAASYRIIDVYQSDIYGIRANKKQIPKDPKFYGEPDSFPIANILGRARSFIGKPNVPD